MWHLQLQSLKSKIQIWNVNHADITDSSLIHNINIQNFLIQQQAQQKHHCGFGSKWCINMAMLHMPNCGIAVINSSTVSI